MGKNFLHGFWNVVALFRNGGYTAHRPDTFASNIIGGWAITVLVFVSGFIVRLIKKKPDDKVKTWDDADDEEAAGAKA